MTAAVRLTLTERSGLWCGDVARADTVTLDVVLTVLRADVAGEHLQATLGSCIGRYRFTTQLRHHRADVDDLTLTALHHLGDDGRADDERTDEVDVDDLLELSALHLVHGDALDDAGIVYEDVDLTYLLVDLLHECLYVIFLRYVAYVALHVLNAGLLIVVKTALQGCFINVVEDDVLDTGGYESLGDVETDTIKEAPVIQAFLPSRENKFAIICFVLEVYFKSVMFEKSWSP